MADPATLPSISEIERAAAFTREPFLEAGEEPASSLPLGSPRRRALDAALAELAAGAKVPSVAWRRQFSLLLGLERLLSQDEPTLADGTVLSAHQVDALSGTLTALLADDARNGHGQNGNGNGEPVALASSAIPGREDEEDEDDEPEEPQDWEDDDVPGEADDGEPVAEQPEDPNADKRFWFEHATGAGKTVAALGFVEASRTGGVLILTHRRNLVDQFHGELRTRGYGRRLSRPLLAGQDAANGPVTVETYQWFVRNAGKISDAYTIVICDEAHTALGDKTSSSIRAWSGPIFIGMTATGALIARHVTDLFPTQTSRFDLAQAARRGVIAPLRCVRIPPGPGVRTIAKVPLRRGEVDTEFDQELLAELLDQLPFNLAVADLYKTRFNNVPGVVYAAGVRHSYNVAQAFRDVGLKAMAVSGETPKRELAQILAGYERGEIDVLVNAQLLAEGWNSPRATVCMHLAPTASKRIYQQRVGRVTRRHQGKEAGIVVDFVHPATKHDDPVVTLHSLLDRDVYRGGAIVVGPVRRGRGRRLRVERRVLPVTADENRRIEVFERELWRIAVEHLDYGEQVQWAALAGARVAPTGWRRARAMLHFDQGGELKRTFLITAVDRNKSPQLRLRALQEIATGRDAEAFDRALDFVEAWPREDKREGVKVVLQALAEKKIGRRDQANNWIWRCANMTREVHEEYAVQRWPETKRLLGLLVNSSGGAHARNARRLVHASRQQDRRLSAALLAAAIPHTAEAGEVINGARTRMSRKPAALARELLRNFPKARGGKSAKRRRSRRKGAGEAGTVDAVDAVALELTDGELDAVEVGGDEAAAPRRRRRTVAADPEREADVAAAAGEGEGEGAVPADEPVAAPTRPTRRRVVIEPDEPQAAAARPAKPSRSRRRRKPAADAAQAQAEVAPAAAAEESAAEPAPAKPRRARRTRAAASEPEQLTLAPEAGDAEPPAAKPRRRRTAAKPAAAEAAAPAKSTDDDAAPAAKRRRTRAVAKPADGEEAPAAKPRRTRAVAKPADGEEAPAAKRRRTRAVAKPADGEEAPAAKPRRARAKTAAPLLGEAAAVDGSEPPAAKPRRARAAAAKKDAADAPAAKPRRPRAAAKAKATEPAPSANGRGSDAPVTDAAA